MVLVLVLVVVLTNMVNVVERTLTKSSRFFLARKEESTSFQSTLVCLHLQRNAHFWMKNAHFWMKKIEFSMKNAHFGRFPLMIRVEMAGGTYLP